MNEPMKPIMVLKKGTLAPDAIEALRANGLCVVESDDPGALKFLDPIPSMAQRTKIEDAAIQLSRKMLNRDFWITDNQWRSRDRSDVARLYVELLVKGTALGNEPTQQKRELEYFTREKLDEIQRLARAEAKADREAAKAAKAKK